jgi:hypothetical protein
VLRTSYKYLINCYVKLYMILIKFVTVKDTIVRITLHYAFHSVIIFLV